MSSRPHQIPQRFQVLIKVENKMLELSLFRALADRKNSFSLFQFLRINDIQCELFKRRSTFSQRLHSFI